MANLTVTLKFTPDSPWSPWQKIFAKDICEIVASMEGFSGLIHRMLPMKFCPDPPWLPWQWNLRQKSYNSNSVRDISKIFASNGRIWEMGYLMLDANLIPPQQPCCHLNVTWSQMVKIVIV